MGERSYIYLDNNATTPLLPEVVEAMMPLLTSQFANPSSIHQFGQSVRHRIECARQQVADLIGAEPREIVFTSGGTESINLAIRGALAANPRRRHVVSTAVEHSAVLRVLDELEDAGYRVDRIGVDREGGIDESAWRSAVTPETALATFQHANNETGVLTDVPRLANVAAEHGAVVHVDAVQTAGKMSLHMADWPVNLLSLSAHKFHGPKGVGALYIRRRTRVAPLVVGGGQERKLRGGTENTAGIVGMGVAAAIARRDSAEVAERVSRMRDAFESDVTTRLPFAEVIGRGAPRIYNTSNIGFEGLAAEAILILLSEHGICASSGSACSSGSLEPSHVLRAMGVEESIAQGAIRFSLSRFNTQAEVDEVLGALPNLLRRLQALRTG